MNVKSIYLFLQGKLSNSDIVYLEGPIQIVEALTHAMPGIQFLFVLFVCLFFVSFVGFFKFYF